jgi:hypothetical protein
VNRDKRKIVANIFADAAKYTLTVGIIGNILAEKFTLPLAITIGLTVSILTLTAYFLTPKDKEE